MQEKKKSESPLVQGGKRPEFTEVKVDSVDDILLELTAAAMEPMVEMRFIPQYVDLLTTHDRPQDFGGSCPIAHCSCQPCRHGNCGGCWVEESRRAVGDDNGRTRELIDNYRNRGW